MNSADKPIMDGNFTTCVSEKYVNAYSKGTLDEFVHSDPYHFAFLEQFWKKEFYDTFSAVTPSLARSYDSHPDTYETKIYHEPYDCVEFVRLVYGKVFRRFLSALVGERHATRPADAYPQLRTIRSEDDGLAIHNDANAPYNGVAFFNINRDWQDGDGGELVIWEHIAELRYKKRFQFPPVGNSLAIMRFSPKSYHSVNTSVGDWARTNILLELNFES